jgi:hypothetical protein
MVHTKKGGGVIYQGAQVPRLGLGGFSHKKRRSELPKGQNMSKNIKRHSIWDRNVYSF